MMSKREKGLILERYVLEKIKVVDKNARLTRASGASYDIGDVQNSLFYVECKNWNKENLILERPVWDKLLRNIPVDSIKPPLYVFQNKHKEKFVVMDIEDFFRVVYKGEENE